MVTASKCLPFIMAAVLTLGCGQGHVTAGSHNPGTPSSTRAASFPRIVLYSASWCPHCKAARKYLDEKKIPYINRDVEEDVEAMDMLVSRYGSNTVPVLVIGNDDAVLKGFDPAVFEKALRDLGEP